MTVVSSNLAGSETGSALLWPIPAAMLNLPATVPAGGNVQSNVIPSGGWQKVAVGLKSTQAGSLQIQRFLDAAGTVPQGGPISAALTANTAATANATDGAPFQSFQVTVTNTGASPATLSNIQALLQSA